MGERGPRFGRRLALLGAAALPALALTAWMPPIQTSAMAAQLRIAVIGDYGYCQVSCANEQAVANMIHGWSPDAIWTVGDNSYENGGNPPSSASEVALDQQPYLADVTGGRLFQTTGNHDWGTGTVHTITPSTNYFQRPPHYVAHFGGGLLDFFATDMNYEDPGGDGPTSAQATQYRSDVAASTAIWKVTSTHQAFYSSGEHGTQTYTHWAILPAIDLFLSGHDHDFEHLVEGGKPYVVDGVGGKNLYPVCVTGCIAGSLWHDASHFGAVRLTITASSLQVDYVAVGGAVLHSFTLTKGAPTPTATAAPTPTPTPHSTPTPTPAPSGSPSAQPTAGPTPTPSHAAPGSTPVSTPPTAGKPGGTASGSTSRAAGGGSASAQGAGQSGHAATSVTTMRIAPTADHAPLLVVIWLLAGLLVWSTIRLLLRLAASRRRTAHRGTVVNRPAANH